MIYLEIVTSILLIIAMGYMSAIETAYLAINEKKLELDSIKKDDKKIKRLKEILKHPSSFVSSMKAGIGFCSLWLGALVVEIFAAPKYNNLDIRFHATAYLYKYILILITILTLSYLLYIVAETIPKSIAIKKKEKIVLKTINFVYYASKFFSPITKFLRATEAVIMRVLDVDRKEKISYNDSEIKEAVEVGQEMGVLSRQEGKVISNFIKLDEMTVEDIMVNIEDAVMLDINSSKEEIKKKILEYGYTRMPVYDSDIRNVVGTINVKNVLKSILANEKISSEKYVKPCMNVSSGKRIDLLFSEMKKQKEHMAIVVKEKNIAVGIVTMEDIIEQIVGKIEDDFEKYN